jgi:hypothetical protein
VAPWTDSETFFMGSLNEVGIVSPGDESGH